MRRIISISWIPLLLTCAVAMAKTEPQTPTCQLRIETDPPDAVVTCDGVSKGMSPATVTDVLPGDHIIAATRKGYRAAQKSITLAQGQTMVVKLALEQLMGLVLIHSEPPLADVRINGADRGKTPMLIIDLPLGKYRVQVSHPGYLPKEIDLAMADRTPVKINAVLTPDSASLVISTTPPGAKVLLNGLVKGTTPCTVSQIPVGENNVELNLEGYTPYKQTLKLVAGQKEEMNLELKPALCELTIVSIPAGARIYVENQFRGESPITIKDLAPGSYRVRAELKGCEPLARTVELAKSMTEEFRIVRDSGVLELVTEPAGAVVLVDGQQVGITAPKGGEDDTVSEPLTIDPIAVGQHRIKLARKGYLDSTFKVDISKDKTTTRREMLKRNFIVDYEVRTKSGEAVQGILIEITPSGDIKLEIRPGIFSTIVAKDIRSHHPLKVAETPK
jgi:hypothetical protein